MISKIELLERVDRRLQENYLERAKRQNWTGWENATMENVKHLSVQDAEVIALIGVLHDILEDIRYEHNYLEDRAVTESRY